MLIYVFIIRLNSTEPWPWAWCCLGGLRDVTGEKRVCVSNIISRQVHLPRLSCVLSFVMSLNLVCCGSRDLEVGGSRKIPAILITVFWTILLVLLRWGTLGGQRRGSVCFSIKRADTGAPYLDRSFIAGIGNRRIGWGETLGDKVCVASALSVSWCTSTVVIGDPGERQERGSLYQPVILWVNKAGISCNNQFPAKITGSRQLPWNAQKDSLPVTRRVLQPFCLLIVN